MSSEEEQNLKQKEIDDKFYSALGRAISAWAVVEHRLWLIFHVLLKDSNENFSSAIYHSVVSPSAKLEMINIAITALEFDKAFNDRWKKIYKDIDKKIKIRHELAHFGIMTNVETSNPYTSPVLRQIPSKEVYRKIKSKKYQTNRYFVEDIENINTDFSKLSQDIADFISALAHVMRQ